MASHYLAEKVTKNEIPNPIQAVAYKMVASDLQLGGDFIRVFRVFFNLFCL